jgi:hypothetical protein
LIADYTLDMAIDPDADLSSDEIAWPDAPRSLYGTGSDWRQNASLSWSRGGWYARVRGFRVAAEVIAGYVAEHRTEQDGLIFPFLYNWRQHIELAMKQLIIQCEELINVESRRPHGHDLDELWTRLRKSLETIEDATPQKAELDSVAALIAELHRIDPYGDAFRYPHTTKGFPTLEGVEILSFKTINDAFVPVANFLETLEFGVLAWLDIKREYEYEIARYYD